MLTEQDVDRMLDVARRVVRRRLSGYPNAKTLLQEEEDIVQEAVVAAWRALSDRPREVENLEAYVSRAAVTACDGYFRAKMPARASLASSIRYFLDKEDGFAYGLDKAGLPVAGYSAWSGKDIRQSDRAKRLCDTPEAVAREALSQSGAKRIPDLLQHLFNWAGCPLPFDTIVAALAEATGKKDAPLDANESGNEIETAAPVLDPIEQMAHRECLETLWAEVKRLRPLQVQALLLNFRDMNGRGIIDLMITLQLCSPEAIAEAMSFELSVVMKLWNDLPLEDKRIAAMMNCTTQQVINLRSVAHRAIQRHMGERFLRNCFA